VSNRSITGYHLHSYLSAFFISAGVPNGEFPEILIAKCRSRFYCTWFFCWGISWGRKRCVREINVSRAWDPVHVGDKALTRETPAKRGRVNRYDTLTYSLFEKQILFQNIISYVRLKTRIYHEESNLQFLSPLNTITWRNTNRKCIRSTMILLRYSLCTQLTGIKDLAFAYQHISSSLV
jgi:hypothetical protein